MLTPSLIRPRRSACWIFMVCRTIPIVSFLKFIKKSLDFVSPYTELADVFHVLSRHVKHLAFLNIFQIMIQIAVNTLIVERKHQLYFCL